MNNIDENFTLNETLSKKIQGTLPFIIKTLQKTEFKYTGKALVSFIPKSGYLINSLLFSCKSGDPYSASILFRSLIEHSFRHLYIFVKALNDKNDTVGNTYYNSLKANEDLESVEKIINYKKIVYPEDTQWNTKGDHNNAIRETAKSFRIEKIFHYLINNNNNENNEIIKRYKKEYLLERLTEYTNMSSSVHGGPFGELALYELQKDKSKLEATLNRFANESFMLHKSIVETTYLFASLMDEEVTKHYDDIVSNAIINAMKTLKCDLCEVTAEGETFEAWMKALMPHYMQAHADVMKESMGKSPEEQETGKQKWMAENKTRFEAAS